VKQAGAAQSGYLSSTDWSTFNSKQSALTTGNISETTSSVLTVTGGTGAIIGSGVTIEVKAASGSQSGYLSSTDWTTFNSKEPAQTKGSISTTTAGVTIGSGTNSTVGPNVTVDIATAGAAATGLLTSTDWSTFNSKEPAQTKGSVSTTTTGVTIGNGTNSTVGPNVTVDISTAGAGATGLLTSTDWSTFNDKVPNSYLDTDGTLATNSDTKIATQKATKTYVDGRIPTASFMEKVYVNYQSGNDTTGTGSMDKPFQTVIKALTTITDANINKPYAIYLGPGRQVETADVLMKPYTFLIGDMQRTSYIRINGGGKIKVDSAYATSTGWTGLKNLYVGGSTQIELDFQTVGGTAGALFICENCTLSGSFTMKGRTGGAGDFIEMYAGLSIGSYTMDSTYYQIQNWYFGSSITITNTQAVVGLSGSFLNIGVDGNVAVTDAICYWSGVRYAGIANTLTTTGTVTIQSNGGLPPIPRRTLSVGTTVTDVNALSHTELTDIGSNSHTQIDSHISNTSNPHSVTKTQVGLGNVDNVQQLPISYLDTDKLLTANSDVKVTSQRAVKRYSDNKFITAEIPETVNATYPIEGNYNGTVRNVSDEATLTSVLAAATTGDVINLTATITLTTGLTVNKSVKFVGNGFALQSAGTGSDPLVLITVTANDVVFDSTLTIKQRKSTNSANDTAVSVTATGFVSNAAVEFDEIGYTLKGSFSIGGSTNYNTGTNNNSHRHIIIYKVSANSQINGVTYSSIAPPTPTGTQYDNFIYVTYGTTGDNIDAILRVTGCKQGVMSQSSRQFFFQDNFTKTGGATPGLIIESNKFNDLNGGIGLVPGDTSSPMDFYSFIAIYNNWQSTLSSDNNAYKGMLYFDSTNSTPRNLGTTTKLYYYGNIHGSILRTAGDYTSALDYTGVSYKNTIFTNSGPLAAEEVVQTNNSIYSYLRNVPSRNSIANLEQIQQDSLEPTGFVDPDNITVTYNSTTRIVTLTHTTALYYYYKGTRYNKGTSWASPAHSATTDVSYYLYIDAAGAGQWTTTFPGFANGVLVAIVYFGSSVKVCTRECHGLMPWQSWQTFHNAVGTYRRSGGAVTAGTYTFNTNTLAAVTPGVDACEIWDEDLKTTVALLADGGPYTTVYFNTTAPVFSTSATVPYQNNGTNPQYNQNPIIGTALTAITAGGNRFNVYGIFIPVAADAASQAYRLVWMSGQQVYTTLAAAQGEDFRSLYADTFNSWFPEYVPYIRLTYNRTTSNNTFNAQLEGISYLAGTRNSLVTVAGFSPTDHNSLSGRTAVASHPAGAIEVAATTSLINTDLQTLVNPYVAALSWSGTGPYTMTVTGATHGKGLDPTVILRETAGGISSNVLVESVAVTDASGDVTITSSTNFTGKVIIR
jgi:hypothetical protein